MIPNEFNARIQTRSEETRPKHFDTLKQAIDAAETDKSIWKISFYAASGDRIRLVRCEEKFVLENILDK